MISFDEKYNKFHASVFIQRFTMKKALLLPLIWFTSFIQAQEIYVIVNPISGGIDKNAVVQELRNRFQPHIFYTKGSGDGTILAKQAVTEKADLVIAVG